MAFGKSLITIGRYWIPTVAKEFTASHSYGGSYNYFYNADQLYSNGRGTASLIGGGSTVEWDNLFLNDKNNAVACKTAMSGWANASYSLGKNINLDQIADAIAFDSGVRQYNTVNFITKNNFSTFGLIRAETDYESRYGKRLEKLVQIDLKMQAWYDDVSKNAIYDSTTYQFVPAFPHAEYTQGPNCWPNISLAFGNGYAPGEV